MENRFSIRVQVVVGDVRKFSADVLVLKYAQYLYGADKAVYDLLTQQGMKVQLPKVGGVSWCTSEGYLKVPHVLFVGVNELARFGYLEIRNFAAKALESMSNVRHVALTLHGPGYGLDEIEAFRSELAGITDAVKNGEYPTKLQIISFVERSERRAALLQKDLEEIFPGGLLIVAKKGSDSLSATDGPPLQDSALAEVGYSSAAKPHVFVAMPFAEAMSDVFHYGIQGAVKATGLLCERADFARFTGDIMNWVKERIASANLVIADLTAANPNVYLEVGYAWGCRIPTVLLCQETSDDLKFDVQGQRCLVYKSIRHLEEILRSELQSLVADGTEPKPKGQKLGAKGY